MMQKIVLAAALLTVGSASAFAADLPARGMVAKAPMMAPVNTWQGLYIGLNAGYAWGNSNTSLSSAEVFDDVPLVGAFPSLKPEGFIGGGQIGYNWQSGMWVLGAEFDFSGLGAKATETVDPLAANNANNYVGTFSSRYDWMLTARGRLGVTVAPSWLLYVTGGLAVTQARDSVNLINTANNAFINFADSKTLTGGTVGAGVEYAFAPNWSVKAEYLHTKFGDSSPSFTTASFGTSIPPVAKFDHRLNIVRAGVNYHF
jgi:outer membrane immunogenic protein